MNSAKSIYYAKRAKVLIQNLESRHFQAFYCESRSQALKKALELIPIGASVSWGGAMSAQQIGLTDALLHGSYHAIPTEKNKALLTKREYDQKVMFADYFITGANAISLDGQMVNIDGTGNRVAASIYGPEFVLVIAGMNKVQSTLEDAVHRARTVAAPMNIQRFDGKRTPCAVGGVCGDCKSDDCICNQIVITRNCRPAGRIKFILVGEDLGM